MAELIHLSYGETKAVITTEGAQLVSFMNGDGREKIWQADPAVWLLPVKRDFPVQHGQDLDNDRILLS